MYSREDRTVRELRAELASLRTVPRSAARTMPPAFYTSPGFLDLEREVLFRGQWICIGQVGEVPRPGDFYTTDLVGEPLLVVRDQDGAVRVLSNVCRHRGNLVAVGAGHAKRFVCGYHAWSYASDGALVAAPLMDGNTAFDKENCRLPTFNTEIWQGFIFVNLDGNAAPLRPALAPIEPLIRNYRPSERHFLHGAEEVWATNWKCLAENFMEGYHLSQLHAKTLHPITPTVLCEKLPNGAGYTGYRSNFAPSCPERGPYPPDLTAQERRSDVFYWIYPSFVVGFCPHFTLHMCLRPLATDRVGIRWGITGVADDLDSQVVRDYVALCKAFCAEDRIALERVQQGLHSRYFRGGPLAPDDYEGTIWDMLQYMSALLGKAA